MARLLKRACRWASMRGLHHICSIFSQIKRSHRHIKYGETIDTHWRKVIANYAQSCTIVFFSCRPFRPRPGHGHGHIHPATATRPPGDGHPATATRPRPHGHTVTRSHGHTAPHGATRRHTAPHGATRRHTAPHGATRRHTAPHGATRRHTAPHGATRRHTATHTATRPHTRPPGHPASRPASHLFHAFLMESIVLSFWTFFEQLATRSCMVPGAMLFSFPGSFATRSWCYALNLFNQLATHSSCYSLNFSGDWQHTLDPTLSTFSSNLQHALGANLFGPSTFWNHSKEVPWHYVPKFLKQLAGSWCYALNYLKQHVTRSWCYALVLKQPRNMLLMLLLSCAQPYGCGGFWHGTRITRCYCSKSGLQGINVHFCCQ